MRSVTNSFITLALALALALIVANAMCSCSNSRPAFATHRCCQPNRVPADRRGDSQGDCRHCHSNAIAADESSFASLQVAAPPVVAVASFDAIRHAAIRPETTLSRCVVWSTASPPDVLTRRGVLQI